MSVSLKIIPKFEKLFKGKDTFILKPVKREKSYEKRIIYPNLESILYPKENLKSKEIINPHLSILNLISKKSRRRKSTDKTNISETISDKFNNYNIYMINKYDENFDSSLSFISQFDLENNENNLDNSFCSSNNEESCEQIEIKTITKDISEKDKEHSRKIEKEWNDIQKLLLGKEI
jgi:hypothetical protein